MSPELVMPVSLDQTGSHADELLVMHEHNLILRKATFNHSSIYSTL